MENKFVSYVNSTMGEIHDLASDLYEAMIDKDASSVQTVVINMKRALSDISRSYEGNNKKESTRDI